MRLERSKLLPSRLTAGFLVSKVVFADRIAVALNLRNGSPSRKPEAARCFGDVRQYGTSKPGSERCQRRTAGPEPEPAGDADRLHPFVHPALVHHRLPARSPLRAHRRSTRLNSSHSQISYAVFCLTKTTMITLVSV